MKLLPKPRTDVRINTGSSPGLGLDVVFVIVLFLLAGFGLDRLFGTLPIFVIVMTVLACVGLFATYKYRYEARMEELDAERRAKLVGGPAAGAAGSAAAPSDTEVA